MHAALDGVVAHATDRHARRSLGAIDAVAHILSALNVTGPTVEQVSALFGSRVNRDPREIAWRSAALRFKNHAAIALLRKRGIAALSERVTKACAKAPEVLVSGNAAILLTSHVGVHNGVSAALHRWRLDVFLLPLQGVELPERRTIALRTAVDVLRGGGLVLAVMDGPFGAHTGQVECLGRRIVLRRGSFALARLTGAAVMPAVARWTRNGEIEPAIDLPLPISPTWRPTSTASPLEWGERQLTELAARWLERYLIANPEEAWPYTIRNLLDAPLAV